MKHSILPGILLSLGILLGVNLAANTKAISPEQKEQARHWMQNQPVRFMENRGQMADEKGHLIPFVLFKASAPGMDMYISEKGLTYLFLKTEDEHEEKETKKRNKGLKSGVAFSRIDMELTGASIKKENIFKEIPSVANYNYIYSHCPEGIYGVKQYEKIIIRNIYPDIDWVLYTSPPSPLPRERGEGIGGFKYDFIVHPGADPAQIKLLYRSAKQLQFNKDGGLLFETPLGILTENAPVVYENESGKSVYSKFLQKRPGSGWCKEKDGFETEISFELGSYNPSQTLIIDPQLVWGTFFGGNGNDGAVSADCDANGNLYITGYSGSANFPAKTWGAAYFDGTIGNGGGACVIRFSATGVLDWATHFGGDSSIAYASSIDVDNAGNIYITGYTWSYDFPTQAWGPAYFDGAWAGIVWGDPCDLFISRFDAAGVLTWSTFYGGSGDDYGYTITTDATGNIYVTGGTWSNDLLTQAGAGAFAGAYYDNTLGGGYDAFILRFSPAGVLDWATYFGGNSSADEAYSIITDAAGNIYVTGETNSNDLITQAWGAAYFDGSLAGTSDAFICRFDATGTLDWSTYYGGSNKDMGLSIATDPTGVIYVNGKTESTDFPTQAWGTAYLDASLGGTRDIFILRFDASGNRDWATYYGGSDLEYSYIISWDNIAIDTCGNLYISFETLSSDMNTLDPGCSYYDGSFNGSGVLPAGDVFLTEFSKTGVLLWATYIGGSKDDCRNPLAISGNTLYACGEWMQYASSAGMPVMNLVGAHYDDTPNGADEMFILKFKPFQPAYTQSQVNPICVCNGSVTVNVTCAIAPINYIWSNGNSTLSTTQLSNTINNLCPGNYWVEITDASCNRDTLFYTLTGSGGLLLNANATHILCNGGATGTATVTATAGTTPYTYVWSSGQSTSAVTGLAKGTYTVTITDINSCTKSATVTVTEAACPCPDTLSLALPNAFSPNNDGENDLFCLQGGPDSCISEVHISIYSRWGEKVYESDHTNFCWDGIYNSSLQNAAVFVYYLEATLVPEKKIIKKGNISLIK